MGGRKRRWIIGKRLWAEEKLNTPMRTDTKMRSHRYILLSYQSISLYCRRLRTDDHDGVAITTEFLVTHWTHINSPKSSFWKQFTFTFLAYPLIWLTTSRNAFPFFFYRHLQVWSSPPPSVRIILFASSKNFWKLRHD